MSEHEGVSLPPQRTAEVPFAAYKRQQAAMARRRLYPLSAFYTLYAILVLAIAFSTKHPWIAVAFFWAGCATWTLIEYLFHRYVLHGRFPPGKGLIRKFLHERLDPLHWDHHARPFDGSHISGGLNTFCLCFLSQLPSAFCFPFIRRLSCSPVQAVAIERDFFQDKSKRNGQTSMTECPKSRELRCIRAWVF